MSQNWPVSQLINLVEHVANVLLPSNCIFLMAPFTDMGLDITLAQSSTLPTSACSANADASPRMLGQSTQLSPFWSAIESVLIKHIPKSARAACTKRLASLVHKVVSDPDSVPNWLELFNWWKEILHPPRRDWKRHNFTSTFKCRISSYIPDHLDINSANLNSCSQQQKRSVATLGQAGW